MKVELPLGDVVDKITILWIKRARISDPDKLRLVYAELESLLESWSLEGLPNLEDLEGSQQLFDINLALWEVEDQLRRLEAAADFGEQFVRLARSVYQINDQRADVKRAINRRLGSRLEEVKSYVSYR
jgi:hypothetical protein